MLRPTIKQQINSLIQDLIIEAFAEDFDFSSREEAQEAWEYFKKQLELETEVPFYLSSDE